MTESIKTLLDAFHTQWGGKMTDFVGYHLPLSYAGGGFIAEHTHTRAHASLFDVSHMGQVLITGDDATAALSRLTPAGLDSIAVGNAKYALLTNDNGGIIDDFIIGNDGDRGWFIVFNASRKQCDIAHVLSHLPSSCKLTELTDWALVALQGPRAEEATKAIIADVARLSFMQTMWFDFEGAACRVARSGYTGEDGFEFSLPPPVAESFIRQLTAHEAVKPAGLGARDSLRLEAGLCLYGHELTAETTPIEAGLLWTIPKSRRAQGEYLGADVIIRQIEQGASRRLVGLKFTGRKVPRAGAPLKNSTGDVIGVVTSGLHAPSLQAAIAMGYAHIDYAKAGSQIIAEVRKDEVLGEVVKLPFVEHHYKKGEKS